MPVLYLQPSPLSSALLNSLRSLLETTRPTQTTSLSRSILDTEVCPTPQRLHPHTLQVVSYFIEVPFEFCLKN